MINRLAHCALLFVAVALPAVAPGQTAVDRRVPVEPNGIVEVRNVAGSVDVTPGEQRELHIGGALADNVERLDIATTGGRVTIEVVLKEDTRSWQGTRLEIQAPPGSELRIDTVSASIGVRGIQGEQRLSSVSGSIRTDGGARVVVKSVSGGVTVTGNREDGVTHAESVSGSVTLQDVAGDVQAKSVSGGVTVVADARGHPELISISGSVSLRTALTNDSRIDANTTSGSVTIVLRGNASAAYDLSTFSGNIENCFGPKPPDTRSPQRQHRFREGNSAARVEVNSMSGSIDLCRE